MAYNSVRENQVMVYEKIFLGLLVIVLKLVVGKYNLDTPVVPINGHAVSDIIFIDYTGVNEEKYVGIVVKRCSVWNKVSLVS